MKNHVSLDQRVAKNIRNRLRVQFVLTVTALATFLGTVVAGDHQVTTPEIVEELEQTDLFFARNRHPLGDSELIHQL